MCDNKTEIVSIPLDEYYKMKRVYEDNKDSNYRIHLSINKDIFINEDGTRKIISHTTTNEYSFPDDTETKLTEIFTEVLQNSDYIKYLESQLEDAKSKIKGLTLEKEDLISQRNQISNKLQELLDSEKSNIDEMKKKSIFWGFPRR